MTLPAPRHPRAHRRLRLAIGFLAALLAATAALWPVVPPVGAQSAGAGTLAWSIGGPGTSEVRQVAADTGGNIYVAGVFTDSIDADPGPDARILASAGDTDIVVAKYATDGRLLWAWSIGGPASDQAYAVAADPQGGFYLAGGFAGSVDFEPDEADASVDTGAQRSGFVARYDGNGALIWVTPLSLAGDDEVMALAVDRAGNAVAAGLASISTTPGHPATVHRGNLFVVQLESDGRLRWSAVLPTLSEGSAPVGIAVAPGGEVFLTASYTGAVRVALGTGVLDTTSAGGADILVLKLTSTGGLAWARSIGGPGNDAPGTGGLAHDADGNVVLAGTFDGVVDLTADGIPLLESQGDRDLLVVSLNGAGAVRWASRFGGLGSDSGLQVVTDAARYVYVAGWFTGAPATPPGLDAAPLRGQGQGGAADGLLVKLAPDGRLAWARGFGGRGSGPGESSVLSSVALDPRGAVLVGGRFFGAGLDVDPGPGAVLLDSLGQADGLVIGVGPDGQVVSR